MAFISSSEEARDSRTATSSRPNRRRICRLAGFLLISTSPPSASSFSPTAPCSLSPRLGPLHRCDGSAMSVSRVFDAFESDMAQAIGGSLQFGSSSALVASTPELEEATGTAAAGGASSFLPARIRREAAPAAEGGGGAHPRPPPVVPITARTPSSLIEKINDPALFRAAVMDESEALVAVRFVADWCKMCKSSAPTYRKWARDVAADLHNDSSLSSDRLDVKFVEVPLNRATSDLVVDVLRVPSMPYCHLYHPVRGLVERGSVGRRDEIEDFARIVEKHSRKEVCFVPASSGCEDNEEDTDDLYWC